MQVAAAVIVVFALGAAACSDHGGGAASRPLLRSDGRVVPMLKIEGAAPFATTSLGYRGRELSAARDPKAARIAIAGGPFAFGRDASTEGDTVGGRLQGLLTKSIFNKTIEIASVGSGARNDRVGRALLESDLGLDLKPDLLVWILEYPDAADAPDGWAIPEANAPHDAPPAAQAETERIGTPEWSRRRDELARRFAVRAASAVKAVSAAFRDETCIAPDAADLVEKVSKRCAELKIAFAAGLLPHPLESDVELRALFLDALAREQHAQLPADFVFDPTARLAAALRARGVDTLDFSQTLREGSEKRKDPLLYLQVGRWTPAAASLVAAAIGVHAVTRGLLK